MHFSFKKSQSKFSLTEQKAFENLYAESFNSSKGNLSTELSKSYQHFEIKWLETGCQVKFKGLKQHSSASLLRTAATGFASAMPMLNPQLFAAKPQPTDFFSNQMIKSALQSVQQSSTLIVRPN